MDDFISEWQMSKYYWRCGRSTSEHFLEEGPRLGFLARAARTPPHGSARNAMRLYAGRQISIRSAASIVMGRRQWLHRNTDEMTMVVVRLLHMRSSDAEILRGAERWSDPCPPSLRLKASAAIQNSRCWSVCRGFMMFARLFGSKALAVKRWRDLPQQMGQHVPSFPGKAIWTQSRGKSMRYGPVLHVAWACHGCSESSNCSMAPSQLPPQQPPSTCHHSTSCTAGQKHCRKSE